MGSFIKQISHVNKTLDNKYRKYGTLDMPYQSWNQR